MQNPHQNICVDWFHLTIAFVFRTTKFLRSLENPRQVGGDFLNSCEAFQKFSTSNVNEDIYIIKNNQ